MALTTALCNSFKTEMAQGLHQLTAAGASGAADTFKIALFKAAGSITGTHGAATTAAGTPGTGSPSAANIGTDEAAGTGYTSGGATLGACTVGTLGNWTYIQWPDASWAGSTLTASGAEIYNSTRANKAVAVLNFGADKSSSSGTFTVDFGNASTASANITFTATTLTRATGDFVADGYQVGHTIITDDATNPGPYTITGVTTTVLTCAAAAMTAGGPRSVSIKEVVIAF